MAFIQYFKILVTEKMLDGWWCRSMASMQAEGQADNEGRAPQPDPPPDDDYSSDSSQSVPEQIDYKAQYCTLKKKLKFLIYVSYFQIIHTAISQ